MTVERKDDCRNFCGLFLIEIVENNNQNVEDILWNLMPDRIQKL